MPARRQQLKLPDDVYRLLVRRFQNKHGEWLVEFDETQWPMEIPLGLPTEQAALRQVEGVKSWIQAWQRWQGVGTLSWRDRRWKALGIQRLPEKLLLQGPEDVAAWAGEATRWARAQSRCQMLTAYSPVLAKQLPRHFDVLADYSDSDFRQLTEMLKWISSNPNSNLYPRQIPIAGVGSKWLESRKGLICNLIATIQGVPTGDRDFFERCGLKPQPQLIRIRVLDSELRARLGGLGDISAPWEEVAKIDVQPMHAFIVENLQTGLAFGDLPGTVVIMRLGYAVDVLSRIPWLRQAQCVYWGDIDTHGFAILNRARSYLPSLNTVLMDESTLMSHRDLCVEEQDQHSSFELPLLTCTEQELYTSIKSNTWGQQLRLEQERIRWDVAWKAVQAMIQERNDPIPK